MLHCNGLMNGLMWTLCWCAWPFAGALAAGTPAVHGTHANTAAGIAADITEISFEQDCSGCPSSATLVLRRDGLAAFTLQGKARLGGASRQERGRIGPQDFAALARFIVVQGYFELQDEYQDTSLQDGNWAVTRVVRGGREKRVFRREDAGPQTLMAVESAIAEVKARIRMTPDVP